MAKDMKADNTKYKAFISYSHAVDGLLAPALQTGLKTYSRPIYKLRALHVFCDQVDLYVNPSLWSLIQEALGKSEFFLLLASPESAESKWVNREVEYWLKVNKDRADKLYIILTEGELIWDHFANDFDWNRTNSLPPVLRNKFNDEPFFLDLRWARNSEDLSLRNPRFLDSVATIAAPLHGKSKTDLIGEDVRSYRMFRMVVATALLLFVMLTMAGVATYYINERRRSAEELRREAQITAEQEQAKLAGITLGIRSLLVSDYLYQIQQSDRSLTNDRILHVLIVSEKGRVDDSLDTEYVPKTLNDGSYHYSQIGEVRTLPTITNVNELADLRAQLPPSAVEHQELTAGEPHAVCLPIITNAGKNYIIVAVK